MHCFLASTLRIESHPESNRSQSVVPSRVKGSNVSRSTKTLHVTLFDARTQCLRGPTSFLQLSQTRSAVLRASGLWRGVGRRDGSWSATTSHHFGDRFDRLLSDNLPQGVLNSGKIRLFHLSGSSMAGRFKVIEPLCSFAGIFVFLLISLESDGNARERSVLDRA